MDFKCLDCGSEWNHSDMVGTRKCPKCIGVNIERNPNAEGVCVNPLLGEVGRFSWEDYQNEIKAIDEMCNERKRQAGKRYAFSNKTYDIGDLIEGHASIIEVDKIKWGIGLSRKPECVYGGRELTKNLMFKKNESYDWIYQSSVQRKIDRPILA